jgi:hypothetical protein
MNSRGHDYMDVGGRITSGTVIETTVLSMKRKQDYMA